MSEVKSEVITTTTTTDTDGLDRKTLFVRSIPFDASSEELSEFFSQFVPVKHAVIVNDNQQKSRGFGFVSFTMDDDTLTALVESRKTKFKGRLLRVDIAKRRDRKSTTDTTYESHKKEPVEKRRARLIIRNLPWSCKKPDTLKKIFSKYGAVFDAYIPKKKGGQMCGFAFVTMKKQAAAEKAIKESVGLKIDGREVAVDLAVEKSKWESIKEEESEEEEEEGGSDDDAEEEQEKEEENDDKEEHKDFHDLNEIKSDEEPESDEEEIEEPEEPPRKKLNRQEPFAIFIRNIPYDADEDTLREHFTTHFGPVKYALPVIDKTTGIAKGSAFAAFINQDSYTQCIENAPTVASTSMLIPDDVSPGYVYQGRILSITSAVDRTSANKLAERNSEKRKEVLGKSPGENDKRNLFLLNEGRITTNSKLAQFISKTDLELREKSYKLRVQQLNKNPTLHLSLTRLAIRNLPRAMNSKALKALGRKAVVSFATEVREEKRQPLSKEEVNRSIKLKHGDEEESEEKKKSNKKMGVVRQAKVIMEVKGTGEIGRSRGYGFIEFRDHKAALMGLRWLNAHEVTSNEITEGLTDDEKKLIKLDGLTKRRLIAEFAIENAQVVKRRREKVMIARKHGSDGEPTKRKWEDEEQPTNNKKRKGPSRKGNMNKGPKTTVEPSTELKNKSGLSDDVKKIIGMKRMRKKGKK